MSRYLKFPMIALALLIAMTDMNPALSDDVAIETEVRESFEKSMEKLRARVTKTEHALEKIKKELARREKHAEELIARRIQELQQGGGVDADDSTSAAVLSAEGWQAWQKQDWRVALTKFEKAVAKDPQNQAALNGLGWTQFNIGETEKALTTFDRLLKLQPDHSGAMNGVGQTLIALGKLDEAETRLLAATKALIKANGESTTVRKGLTASWFGLVRTLLAQKKFEEAERWAKRYLKHSPNDDNFKSMLQQAQAKQ